MKRTTNNYQVSYVNELLTVAEISAKSTIKYLYCQSVNDFTRSIRFGLLGDMDRLQRENNIVEEVAKNEKRVAEIDEEIRLNEKTIKEIKSIILDLKGGEYEKQQRKLQKLNVEIEMLHKQRNELVTRNGMLYKYMGERLTDGIDLYQIAVMAIWECMPILKAYERHNKLDIDNIGKMVVECYTTKKGSEKKYITLKSYSDRKIREYVNKWKRKKEYKDKDGKRKLLDVEQYIIVGYDEDGNELLLQCSALENGGGVDTWEERQDFLFIENEVENALSESELLIVKYLQKGLNQKEIGKKLNLKQNTISDKVNRIRNKIENLGLEEVKKYLTEKRKREKKR